MAERALETVGYVAHAGVAVVRAREARCEPNTFIQPPFALRAARRVFEL